MYIFRQLENTGQQHCEMSGIVHNKGAEPVSVASELKRATCANADPVKDGSANPASQIQGKKKDGMGDVKQCNMHSTLSGVRTLLDHLPRLVNRSLVISKNVFHQQKGIVPPGGWV